MTDEEKRQEIAESTSYNIPWQHLNKKNQKLVKKTKAQIEKLQKQSDELEIKLQDILLSVPNIPHESVVVGEDETQNKEMHK